jgi:hypothetical protein
LWMEKWNITVAPILEEKGIVLHQTALVEKCQGGKALRFVNGKLFRFP